VGETVGETVGIEVVGPNCFGERFVEGFGAMPMAARRACSIEKFYKKCSQTAMGLTASLCQWTKEVGCRLGAWEGLLVGTGEWALPSSSSYNEGLITELYIYIYIHTIH
jgi:hypothetical protein